MSSQDAHGWIGQTLAERYHVTEKLSAGGMGTVYKASDIRLVTDVVIKVPHPMMIRDAEFATRFHREIRSLVRLSHPNIVQALDVGVHDGLPFAVMQYLSGGSLEDRVRPCRPAEVAAWLPDVAAALDFLHSEGLVHRDIKPDNILFDVSGRAYLGDFGIAKVLAEGEESDAKRLTGTGTLIGTAEYMAPEMLIPSAYQESYNERIDQYSLAVTVYEQLSGRPPFRGNTMAEVVVLLATKSATLLHNRNSDIPELVSRVVGRSLFKKPDRRYASCLAFSESFVSAVSGEAAPAVGKPSPPRRKTDAPAAAKRQATQFEQPNKSVAPPRTPTIPESSPPLVRRTLAETQPERGETIGGTIREKRPPASRLDSIFETNRSRTRFWIIPTVVALLLFVGATGVGSVYWYLRIRNNDTAVTDTTADGDTAVTDTTADGDTAVTDTTADGDTAVTDTTADGDTASSSDTSDTPQEPEVVTTTAKPETPDVASNPPLETETNPPSQPFQDHRPFDDLREIFKTDGTKHTWFLPAPSQSGPSSSDPIPIYVTSVADLKIALQHKSTQSNPIEINPDPDRTTWTVTRGAIEIGSIKLTASPGEPVQMQWTWDEAVVDDSGDGTAETSKAVCAFRLSQIEITSGKDSATLVVDVAGWTPFQYLSPRRDPNATVWDNRHSLFDVKKPIPSANAADLQSKSIYIIVKDIENQLQIRPVSGCDLFGKQYEVVIRRPTLAPRASEPQTWKCEVGIKYEGDDSGSVLKVGDYIIEKPDRNDDLVKVSFQWLSNPTEEFSEKVLWTPIAIFVDTHHWIAFLKEPDLQEPVSLAELAETNACKIELDFKYQMEETLKGLKATFSFNDQTQTRDADEEMEFYFALDGTLLLTTTQPQHKVSSLGNGKLTISMTARNRQTKASLNGYINRLNPDYTTKITILDIVDAQYRDPRQLFGFDTKRYKTDLEQLKKILTKYNTNGLLDDYQRIELVRIHEKNDLKKRMQKYCEELREPIEQCQKNINRLQASKHKDTPTFKELIAALQNVTDQLKNLRTAYEDEQIDDDFQVIKTTLAGFENINLNYNIYKEFSGTYPAQEKATVRLYVLTTDAEDTPFPTPTSPELENSIGM